MLIGIDNYAKLGPAEQLTGSVNDVRIMQDLLQQRFGFQPSDIITLTNREATGDAIRRAFATISNRLQNLPAGSPSARVVFHFSGHGSQVLDQREGDPDCDEEDGLDETLVPADAEKQGGHFDLRDDELHRFVENVCKQRAVRACGSCWTAVTRVPAREERREFAGCNATSAV